MKKGTSNREKKPSHGQRAPIPHHSVQAAKKSEKETEDKGAEEEEAELDEELDDEELEDEELDDEESED